MDEERISEPVAHRRGDGSRRKPSDVAGMASPEGKSGEVDFAREKTGSDGPGRPKTDSAESAPRRTRTFNPLIKSQHHRPRKANPTHNLKPTTPRLAHPLPIDISKTDAELARLLQAWPDLPEALRAGILAMVSACREPAR